MARNAALDTKIKAMQSHLLKQTDYEALVAAEDLKEVTRYLKEYTHYGPYLEGIDPDKAHRKDIEAAFTRILTDETEKAMHYVQGAERDFLMLMILRTTIQSFKVLLRGIARGQNLKELAGHLAYSARLSGLPFDKLIEADSWESFKDALKGTPYYRSVETYDKLDSDEDLFTLEKALERRYYDEMAKRLKKIDAKKYQGLIETMRENIDMLNLMWIYRAKKFYHFSADRILTNIYHGGRYLSQEDINRLAAIDDYDELMTQLRKYKAYNFLFNHEDADMDLHMDRRRKRKMYYDFQKLLRGSEGVSRAYAYVRLLEDEMEDITSIIESKRYNLPPKDMTQYLIRDVA